MRKPVDHWSGEDVMEWMNGLGETIREDCREIFKREVRGRKERERGREGRKEGEKEEREREGER